MSSIDERVVQMKFDNSGFQKGVSDTRGALDSLKQGLNLDASTKSLEGLDAAGKRFSLASMAKGVSDLGQKFSALSIIGITALTNLTNKAVNAGLEFAKGFTVAPIMDGFKEYEEKMGSIQTILANTAKDGTNLKQVSAALGELNTYSDKTIYNFGDMTRNIGMFTNAGINLKDSVAMIKGFSNEAAMSGTNAQQAAGAAYQLSQAMSKGKVTLEDWRSLTNASMGNANMKQGLTDIAKAMGTLDKAGVSAASVQKDFNGTLEKGWLTADVMTKYLKIQAGEMDRNQMKSMGLTDAQINNFIKMQKIAEESATKVRTWTQLVGTLKESVGSSWATTAEILLGDFDSATDLFTNINNKLGGMLGKMGDARNKLLQGWSDGGGRKMLLDGLSGAFNSLMDVMGAVGAAWRETFPPITVDTLIQITRKFKEFLDGLKPSAAVLANLKTVFKGVFAILDIGWITIQRLWGVFQRLFKGMDGAGTGVLGLAARFAQLIIKFRDFYRDSEKIHAFFVGLSPILKLPGQAINWLVTQFTKLWDAITRFDFSKFKVDMSGFTGAWNEVKASLDKLKPTGDMMHDIWQGLVTIFEKAIEIGGKLVQKLTEGFGGVGKAMEGAAKGVDFNTILGMLGVGALGGVFLTVKKFFKSLKGVIEDFGNKEDSPGILDTIKTAFGGLTDTLSAMQTTLKASTLILIAGAIALLTLSVVELSKVDAAKLPAVLGAITAMFIQLSTAMAVLDKINITTSVGKMIALGTGMILFSVAINILAKAVKALSELDWQGLAKGLVGTTVLIGSLAGAMKLMPKNPTGMIGMGIALIGLAVAIKILASAVGDFAGMDWQKMMQGLIGVGIVLGGLALFTRLAKVNKGAVAQAGGLILLGVALKILASAVKDFSEMDPGKIQQGLGALTGVLAELAIFSRVVNPSGMIAMGVAMVILGGALKIIYSALTDFAKISWEEMGRGLVAMGGALAIIAGAMWIMPPGPLLLLTATSLVIVAAALKILASALKDMGGMSWDEIGKGMTVLGASLLIMAIGLTAMLLALPGAAALMVAVIALAAFVPVLQALGSMSWEQIWTGLGALALSLTALGIAGVVLGVLSPLFLLFGAALVVVGAGLLLAGTGMFLFATGIAALATAGAVGVAVLVTSTQALLGLIPYAMTQLGLGIVAMAKVLGENVPAFVEAGVKLLMGVIQGLRTILPAIVKFIVDMILLLLNTLAVNVPKFVNAGFKILIGFLNGIANNIGRVVDSAANIIINFLNALAKKMPQIITAGVNLVVKFVEGIAKNIKKVTDAGADLVIKAVNAVADTINEKRQEMQAAGEKLAWAIADGLTGGMASKARDIAQSAWDLGAKAIGAIKQAIDSNSPSKESRKLGTYLGQGFALGISDLGHLSQRSAGQVGSNALEAMKASIANAGADLDGGMLMHPTIAPVLDLTNVQKESERIAGLLTLPTLDIMGTYQSAAAIVASQREQARIDAENNDSGPDDGSGNDGGITYIQNNYSPKALTRAEIYRGTKSQLSDLKTQKGVLTVNGV